VDISRRDFLKFSGGAAAAGAAGLGIVNPGEAKAAQPFTTGANETTTICPYCAVGCGIIAYTKNGKLINTEGDPDHPINEGTLCSKGASLYQVVNNPERLTKPRYRAPGSAKWEEMDWGKALDMIARRIKDSRDRTFTKKNKDDKVVNRTDGIAHVGSAALDNEECYILQKWLRSLGLVYIEHQARI